MRAPILSFLGWMVVSLWSRTLRADHRNRHIPDRFTREGRNVIFAFWHGSLLLLLGSNRDRGILIPASESRDGEIMARVLRRFGYSVVRGSSKRRGHAALRGLINGIRSGRDAAIAVDGPRGPLHEVKAGALFLAGTLQVPVIPVAAAARNRRVIEGSWEKTVMPAPFTRTVVIYGEPLWVAGKGQPALEQGRRELQSSLQQLTREAQRLADAPAEPLMERTRSAITAIGRSLRRPFRPPLHRTLPLQPFRRRASSPSSTSAQSRSQGPPDRR